METKVLETARLWLRPWKIADKLAMRKINGDARVMEFYPAPLTETESDAMVDRLQRYIENYGFGLWAVERKSDSVLIGGIGLQQVPYEAHFTPAVEVGWRVGFEYWNQGYATEAAQRSLQFGFEVLNLEEIVAMTYVKNLRSRRVMEKLGMTYDPKDDFENPHPRLEGSYLRPHVLYRIARR